MANSNQVLVVVLNFNGWEETLTCVEAILAQAYENFHLMLIDNGSKDESLEKLAHFEGNDKITFVKQPVNLGFAGGVNIGIRHAIENNIPYTALLNNDAIIAKDWLATLVKTLETTEASSATGLLLSSDGKKVESTGDSYSRWGLPFPRQRDEPVKAARDSEYVFGGTAGASLYKTSLFEDIGLFDETFFAYFEDTDISFRAQLAGHKAYYEKTALAYHDHGTTSSKMPGFTVLQTFKNLPLFFWKDVPLPMLFSTGWRFFGCYGLMYIRAVLRGQFLIATKGVLKHLTLLPHAFSERRKIQKKRRVSMEYLQSVIYPDLPPSNKKYARRVFHR
jgi:GT2 family glycosyltransferase